MTITEKILARHAGKEEVHAGEFVTVTPDFIFGNELGTGLAIEGREELLQKRGIFDTSRVAVIPDHFTPNKDITSAELSKTVREFVRRYHVGHYFEVGRMGIEHVILHEKGLVVSGDVIVGADSHSCTYGALGAFSTGVGSTDFFALLISGQLWFSVPETIKVVLKGKLSKWVTAKDVVLYLVGLLGADGARYKALEFHGDGVRSIPLSGRFTICNMAIEAGAKNAVFPADELTIAYQKGRAQRQPVYYEADADAVYCDVIEIDLTSLKPQLSCPHRPDNVKPFAEAVAGKNLPVDQVFIGSCINGRIEDLREAAGILKDRVVHPDTRLIVTPGSQEVYLQAVEEGLVQIFIKAGAVVSTPTCGACIGGHMGVLAGGERCVSTTNRNFRGRMGHYDSEVYLSGVPVAAASAVLGRIALPEELQP
ncbi:MAG: 3-isopropylmalate dehydratase large subunit [Methylobacteriaceae bacterium]|nr:3-isopropylmalate dehydratase large subunit [Methylobacteriaceae bacterium]